MFYAPCDLKIIKNSNYKKHLLISKNGFIFYPESTSLICPVDGTIEFVHPFVNLFIIKTRSGEKITIKLGVNTDQLYGFGFNNKVVVGQPVSVGDRLVSLDIPTILNEAESIEIGVSFDKEIELKNDIENFKQREEMII